MGSLIQLGNHAQFRNGATFLSYLKLLIKAFKERVSSYPNSVFEAEVCLDATLTDLNDIGLLSETSLVITPNAYNEGVLYDVIPNTPLGDMTVVRATTATRVNSQGLVEILPRNVLRNSNNFIGTGWLTNSINVTVNSNVAISPNGKLDASKITTTTVGSDGIYQAIEGVVNSSYVRSIYIKSVSGNNETVRINDPYNSPFDGVLLNINGDWNRYNYTAPLPGSYINGGIWINSIPTDGIYVYGAQMEQGSTITEYFPTTTRLNIPRIDYTNSSCPSILVEPQRTNLLTYSEQFNDASWSKGNLASVLVNTTNAPDGTLTADTSIPSTDNVNNHFLQKTFSPIINQFYTISLFVKPNGYNGVCVNYGASRLYANFNLISKTVANVVSNGTDVNQHSATITELPNGWIKVTLTGFLLTIAANYIRIIVNKNEGPYGPDGETYAGNGTSGLYVWGAQVEQGAYPTSYIPTVASTVTRNADVISKTGISGLIGQTEGTLFFDAKGFTNDSLANKFITYSDGTTNNMIGFYYGASSEYITGYFRVNSVTYQINSTISQISNSKIILKYSSNNYNLFINGNLIGTGTSSSGFSSPLSVLKSSQANDTSPFNGNINSIQLYKTALTDAECIALTTL